MELKIWGCRGSIPSPGYSTLKVGGNTTCFAVKSREGNMVIVDAGTGIRNLGSELIRESANGTILLLFTHSHWDHVEGITFFQPIYTPEFTFDIYGHLLSLDVLERDILEREDSRYFPVNKHLLRAKYNIHKTLPKELSFKDITVRNIALNHPGDGYGYKIIDSKSSIVVLTDNELGKKYKNGSSHNEFLRFCEGASMLIHDGQYLPEQIANHFGWGHSTYEEAILLAAEARVPKLLLTHHDPDRSDDECFTLLESAREFVKNKGFNLEVNLAIENEVWQF